MPTTLRDLLPRVMMYRPDLDDAKGMFCLIEAMRQLTQNAAILRDELGIPITTTDRATYVSSYLDSSRTFYRAEYVRYLKMPDGARFAGYWDAANNVPDLGATNIDPVPFDRIVTIAPLPSGRQLAAAIYLGKGKYAVFGGNTSSSPKTGTEIQYYDSHLNTWTGPFTVEPTGPARFSSLVTQNSGSRSFAITGNNKVLLCAGVAIANENANKTFLLDCDTLQITPGPDTASDSSLGYQSYQFTMNDGATYLWCGELIGGAGGFLRYVWQNNTISRMSTFSYPQTVTWNPDDMVIANVDGTRLIALMAPPFGGFRSQWAVYNTSTNTWDAQPITSGSVDRGGLSASGVAALGLGDGRALLAGGATEASRAIQIIDVNTRIITTIATMPFVMQVGCISKIGGTRYLFTGGIDSIGTGPAKAYIFDMSDLSIKDVSDFSPNNLALVNTVSIAGDGKNVFMFGGFARQAPLGDGTACRTFEPAQSSYTRNGYWIVSKAGSTDLGSEGTSHWELNDVVYNDGGSWRRYDDTKFVSMSQCSEVVVNDVDFVRGYEGVPGTWSQLNGYVYTYPRTLNQDVLKVNYSYSFSGNEQNVIEVPNEVEQIVVDGALGKLMLIPGVNANAGLATAYDMKFKKGIATMRAVGMFGYGGNPTYNVGGAFGPQWNTIAINWMER